MPRKIRLLNSWTVYSEKEKAPPEHSIALYPPRTLCLDKLYNARTLTVLDNLSCVHTQWQNALAPARIPYWIGLFSHLRTVISARFLQPREAQPRRFRKWSVTYRIGLVPHFGTVSTEIRTVSEVNKMEQVLESSETKVNIYEWEMGFSSTHTLAQPHDVRCVWTCSSSVPLLFTQYKRYFFVSARRVIWYGVKIALLIVNFVTSQCICLVCWKFHFVTLKL